MQVVPSTQEVRKKRRLYYVSDVHLELRKDKVCRGINFSPLDEDGTDNYLALCGDIGHPYHDSYREFLERHSPRFKHIFVVTGNHEYYSNKQRTIVQINQRLREVCAALPNVTFLQQSTFDIDEDVIVAGCTLWSPVTEVAEMCTNDFTHIFVDSDAEAARLYYTQSGFHQQKRYVKSGRQPLKYLDVLQLNGEMHEWLQGTIQSASKKVIVLTHHAPSRVMLGQSSMLHKQKLPAFIADQFDSMNCSDCDELFAPPLLCWLSGHTHDCIDTKINGIRSLSNCFGYVGEKTGFDATRFVEF